jgi:hypothetical protein
MAVYTREKDRDTLTNRVYHLITLKRHFIWKTEAIQVIAVVRYIHLRFQNVRLCIQHVSRTYSPYIDIRLVLRDSDDGG